MQTLQALCIQSARFNDIDVNDWPDSILQPVALKVFSKFLERIQLWLAFKKFRIHKYYHFINTNKTKCYARGRELHLFAGGINEYETGWRYVPIGEYIRIEDERFLKKIKKSYYDRPENIEGYQIVKTMEFNGQDGFRKDIYIPIRFNPFIGSRQNKLK